MRIAVTGATGYVGHFIAGELLRAGHRVTALGRRPSRHAEAGHAPFDLDFPPPDLSGADALVHAALAHVPGRYRGGEGEDPARFVSRNRDGTRRLFEAARAAGVGRLLFLSSRAVYGAYPPGTALHEGLVPRPDTLYGEVKLAGEQALADLAGPGCAVAVIRATGVYGPPVPGLPHKWDALFAAFARGERLPPRAGTEVHADDLARAVRLLAEADADILAPRLFNVSDFALDRRALLAAFARCTGLSGPLPEAADRAGLRAMTTDRLRALGWQPRGPGALAETVRAVAARHPGTAGA